MKKPPVLLILLVLGQLVLPVSSPACPVFVPFWENIESADLIVVARVARVERDSANDDPRHGVNYRNAEIAVLEVLDTWKGTPPTDLEVSFQFGAPPDYQPGKVVLAFLQRGETTVARRRGALAAWNAPVADPAGETDSVRVVTVGETGVPVTVDLEADVEAEAEYEWTPTPEDEAQARAAEERYRNQEEEEIRTLETWAAGRWLPVETSYAVSFYREAEGDGLRDLVVRAASLQAGGRVTPAEKRAWLISAVDVPATRGEALYELLGKKATLSKEDFASLRASFLRAPALDDTDLVMLRIFAGRTDLEVDRAAAAVVEAGVRMQPVPAWVVSFVEETLRRYGDDFAARIGHDDRDARGRMIYTGPYENSLWTIWEVARRQLGIPEMPPAAPPRAGGQS